MVIDNGVMINIAIELLKTYIAVSRQIGCRLFSYRFFPMRGFNHSICSVGTTFKIFDDVG